MNSSLLYSCYYTFSQELVGTVQIISMPVIRWSLILLVCISFTFTCARVLKNEDIIFGLESHPLKFSQSAISLLDIGSVPRTLNETLLQSIVCIAENFDFIVIKEDCSLLRNYMRNIHWSVVNPVAVALNTKCDILSQMKISVQTPCNDSNTEKIYPTSSMNESYQLSVTQSGISLTSQEVWGAMRGLETLAQMVMRLESGQIGLLSAEIVDRPRFAHRGLMLDTSRHYLRKAKLFETLSLMAMTKMNVFHWHIVDDQSFPYSSAGFPELSHKGAYDPYAAVYTQEDVADVLEFARRLGIRVVPEFDTPGHTLSWGQGQPDLLTPCFKDGRPDGRFGPIDPSREANYDFLSKFFAEVLRVFPDPLLHLGGDEVSFQCWQSNPHVVDFMKRNNISSFAGLEAHYVGRLLGLVSRARAAGRPLTTAVWQEVFDNKVKIPDNVLVHVWKDPWPQELAAVTKAGLPALLSTCWYLNYISYGADTKKYYDCDPAGFPGSSAQRALVRGGEACMWAEFVDDSNVISRTWPRASAVAEALWTDASRKDYGSFESRVQALQCRMIKRGFSAQPPDGPSSCERALPVTAGSAANVL